MTPVTFNIKMNSAEKSNKEYLDLILYYMYYYNLLEAA